MEEDHLAYLEHLMTSFCLLILNELFKCHKPESTEYLFTRNETCRAFILSELP